MKKIFFLLSIYLIAGMLTLKAQNNTQADSITIVNQQLKAKIDSLTKVQQQQATVKAPPKNNKDTRPIMQRLSFNLNSNFWINPGTTYFELSPIVMYHFPKTFSVGAGPTYLYRHDRLQDANLNGWGGKIIGRADITRWLYASTEYLGISNQYIFLNNSGTRERAREYVDSWFMSLGINVRIGIRHSINFQALYDVLYKKGSTLYSSPWTYRIGLGF